MRIICIVSFVMSLLPGSALRGEVTLIHPEHIRRCLERDSIGTKVEILYGHNPYYVTGHFDGDRRLDYAVAVKGPKTRRNGVLICAGNRKATILGADNLSDPPFSDMPKDNFLAPEWWVVSREQAIIDIRRNHNIKSGFPLPVGEAIEMVWEDGSGLVYSDGQRFRWIGGLQ